MIHASPKFQGAVQFIAPMAVLIAAMVLGASNLKAQMVRERQEITKSLTLDKVHIADGVVSGEVVNSSPHTMRDVQLFIRYTWLWDNETKPGKNDPGTSTYYTLPKEIPPRGRSPFTFKPSSPLPTAAGGHFETSVAIAGFTEVIPGN
ncbi:MAG: hypothetical protein ACM3SP_02615 [Chloroflexota bacterium]